MADAEMFSDFLGGQPVFLNDENIDREIHRGLFARDDIVSNAADGAGAGMFEDEILFFLDGLERGEFQHVLPPVV